MAQVRCFAYTGVLPLVQGSDNGVKVMHTAFTFAGRYLARQNLTVSESPAVNSDAAVLGANAHARILRVQCDPGVRCHYELIPAGYSLTEADTSSPVLSGSDILEWGPGWRISLLQAADPS